MNCMNYDHSKKMGYLNLSQAIENFIWIAERATVKKIIIVQTEYFYYVITPLLVRGPGITLLTYYVHKMWYVNMRHCVRYAHHLVISIHQFVRPSSCLLKSESCDNFQTVYQTWYKNMLNCIYYTHLLVIYPELKLLFLW